MTENSWYVFSSYCKNLSKKQWEGKDRDSVLQSVKSSTYKKYSFGYIVQPPPEKEETGQMIDPSLQCQWKQKLFHNFYVSWA